MFETTALNRKNRQVERLWGLLFLLMTVLLILPVVIILSVLVYKGGPSSPSISSSRSRHRG